MSSPSSLLRSMMRGSCPVSNDNIIPFPIERLCQPGSVVIFGVQSDKGFYHFLSGDAEQLKALAGKLVTEILDVQDGP